VTAGTIFHSTKLPLTVWFLAIYHLSQSKGGISSVELGRRLGVRQGTAWNLKQKLMQAMLLREATKPKFDGRVEIDDAYLGGQRSGKRGRGAAGKTPFVAAVETTADKKPRRLRLKVVKGFRKQEIAKLAKANIAAGTKVESDALSCWSPRRAASTARSKQVQAKKRQAWPHSSGSTRRSATSRPRSPAPIIMSAPNMPSATSLASPGVSIDAMPSTP